MENRGKERVADILRVLQLHHDLLVYDLFRTAGGQD